MALIFQRLAHNFAKNGYFPTDSETMTCILQILSPAKEGEMNILDPCAGEGVALAECKEHLSQKTRTTAYGIEYDETRAWHAKSLLDRCIHADIQHCVIGQRSFGLLFLNPPYGDLTADKAQTGSFMQKGRPRLEKLFYQLTIPSLQYGGVLVLIIPHYSLDREFAHWISHHFDDVKVFLAPEQRFKQIVLFGVRKKFESIQSSLKNVKKYLEQIGQGQLPEEFGNFSNEEPYSVPAKTISDVKFSSSQLDVRQLTDEISRNQCLWNQFNLRFGNLVLAPRRPLMSLSSWHLALSLAAGQVSGIVNSNDGRTYIIKGDTHKEIQISSSYEENPDGSFTEIATHLDKFVPVIRAVDMTKCSNTYGQIFTVL